MEKDFSSSDKEASSKEMNSEKTSTKEDTAEEISTEKGEPQKEDTDLRLTVNSTPVILKGKKEYRVVDILDFYDFDVKTAHGNRVVIKVNGTPCSFSTRLSLGDYVELYWED